jgi:hypothetical protein
VLEVMFVVGSQIFASKFAKAFRLAPQGFGAPAGRVAGITRQAPARLDRLVRALERGGFGAREEG